MFNSYNVRSAILIFGFLPALFMAAAEAKPRSCTWRTVTYTVRVVDSLDVNGNVLYHYEQRTKSMCL